MSSSGVTVVFISEIVVASSFGILEVMISVCVLLGKFILCICILLSLKIANLLLSLLNIPVCARLNNLFLVISFCLSMPVIYESPLMLAKIFFKYKYLLFVAFFLSSAIRANTVLGFFAKK